MKRTLGVLFALFLIGCGEDGCNATVEDARVTCTLDNQCDDGNYCNGIETCSPDDPFASSFGCVRGVSCRFNCVESEVTACFEDGGDFDSCCLEPVVNCQSDSDCDDGAFCNGTETCDEDNDAADERGCVAGVEPCRSSEFCDDTNDGCVCPDEDGDGHGVRPCGDDCDDNDASRFPGNAEICDDGHDEDCDPTTFGPDEDDDGYVGTECCNGDDCGLDCESADRSINPATVEVCNEVDDNCNGEVDEGTQVTLYRDDDGDGFGVESDTKMDCAGVPAYSPTPGDCDDTNPQVFPGAIVCDPQPNSPNQYQLCNQDGTFSQDQCDPQTERCVEQPGGQGVCASI